ncbi:hypothetical protein GCM10010464_48820 [Pseudonocardia yunnanensis]|uniref:DUF222 domain-containing protein n=1 Tax=Pseudonocardia yunnanensis TaxID=58107 RepID=A0ABW4F243_9PSEU
MEREARDLDVGSGAAGLRDVDRSRTGEIPRAGSADSPGQRSPRWAEATGNVVEPWYRHAGDRQRLAEVENHRTGIPHQLDDNAAATAEALQAGARHEPEILRGLLDVGPVQALPCEVLARQAQQTW